MKKPDIGRWDTSGAMKGFVPKLADDQSSKSAKAITLFTPTHWMSFSIQEQYMETKAGSMYHLSGNGLFSAFGHENYHAAPNQYHELRLDPDDRKNHFYATAKKSNSRQVGSFQDVFRQLSLDTAEIACNQ